MNVVGTGIRKANNIEGLYVSVEWIVVCGQEGIECTLVKSLGRWLSNSSSWLSHFFSNTSRITILSTFMDFVNSMKLPLHFTLYVFLVAIHHATYTLVIASLNWISLVISTPTQFFFNQTLWLICFWIFICSILEQSWYLPSHFPNYVTVGGWVVGGWVVGGWVVGGWVMGGWVDIDWNSIQVL